MIATSFGRAVDDTCFLIEALYHAQVTPDATKEQT